MIPEIVLTGVFRGTLLLVIVLLISLCMRRRSAALQHALLWIAIAVQPLVPLVSLVVPASASRAVPQVVSNTINEAQSRVGLSAISTTPAAVAINSEPLPTVPWIEFVAAAWVAGLVVLLVWMLYGRFFMRRVTRGLEPERSGPLYESLNAIASELSIRRPVTLFVGGPLFVPVTSGLVYPVILLPDNAREWPAEELRVTLVHELAHVRRNDSLFHFIAWAAVALVWFNPLGWIALRRMRASAERAADDSVLRAGVRPSAYVDSLVDLVKRAGSDSFAGSAAFAMARRSEFERRMLAVLDEKTSRNALRGTPAFVGGTVFAIVVVLISAIPGPAEAAKVLPSSFGAARSDADAWIKVAQQEIGDPGRVEPLQKAMATGEMSPSQVDRYLDVVSGMSGDVAKSQVITALVAEVELTDAQRTRVLELTRSISGPVPSSLALIEIARSQQLSPAQRSIYLAIASSLDGPPMQTAIAALK